MPVRSALAVLALVLAGCGGYGSTLLPTAEPDEVPYEYRVEVPDGYDVRSVDYDASLVGLSNGESSTVVRGRGVVTVYAVERATGQEVVLIYDDVLARSSPTAIVRIERTPLAQAERR
ncbi:hypothetical protein [Rubrivirga sp.]|uniref:hypothetical protein n=1 Tax=Rubrivirga sp. TaxID=1885344 RepID=UPI003B51D4E9